MDELIEESLTNLLNVIGRDALQTLLFDPVASAELNWHIARLSHRVASAYLPLATDDSGSLAAALARRSVEIDREPL